MGQAGTARAQRCGREGALRLELEARRLGGEVRSGPAEPGQARWAFAAVAALAAVVAFEDTGTSLGLGLTGASTVRPFPVILGQGLPPQARTTAPGFYFATFKIL